MSSGQTKEPRRTSVAGPEQITTDMSLFEYLANCRPPIDQKVIDIALSQMQVTRDLKDDAAQEIRMVWATLKPDTARYTPGQIASYAHRVATHAALRLRRELASSVRLPGSAFRRRKDGSSYVTPGVLSVPLDWSELESWYNAGDVLDTNETRPPVQAILEHNLDDMLDFGVDVEDEDSAEDDRRRKRLETLEQKAKLLSRPQYNVLSRLIAGESFDDIQSHTGYKRGVVLREVAIGASLLGPSIAIGAPGA